MIPTLNPNRGAARVLIAIATWAVLQGCAAIGSSDYACSGRPDGALCLPPTETYRLTEGDDYMEHIVAHRVPEPGSARSRDAGQGAAPRAPDARNAAPGAAPRPYMPEMEGDTVPLRTPAQVMRIWVAPWENAEGDLVMNGLIFTEVQRRRWQVGLERPDLRDVIRPLEATSSGNR